MLVFGALSQPDIGLSVRPHSDTEGIPPVGPSARRQRGGDCHDSTSSARARCRGSWRGARCSLLMPVRGHGWAELSQSAPSALKHRSLARAIRPKTHWCELASRIRRPDPPGRSQRWLRARALRNKDFGVSWTLSGEWHPTRDPANDFGRRRRARECQAGLMGYR